MNFTVDLETIDEFLKRVFGESIPPWVTGAVAAVLLGAIFLFCLWWFLSVSLKIVKLVRNELIPLFYNKDKRRRSIRRRRFAKHMESEIQHLNNLESWQDYKFAELEAEVEAEGNYQRSMFGLLFQRSRAALRREKSLTKALKFSTERLILLQGDPGSGKSVALRHVAKILACKAAGSRTLQSIIPVYVNFKEFVVESDSKIDRNAVERFVKAVLNKPRDRDIEQFLEEEYDRGLTEGTWLFLFDSFDEIPAILSSTEVDKSISTYADAISTFLRGMNNCRGIVASRHFRGPERLGWPRFRILSLSEKRQGALIRKANLEPKVEKTLTGLLNTASGDIRSMASNPMFLGLLCEHLGMGNPFPGNAHSVFATYINTRFARDETRLWQRYMLKPMAVKFIAEHIAYCMGSNPELGLSPTREAIIHAFENLGIATEYRVEHYLDALEYLKMARSEQSQGSYSLRTFTFSHRRFQEYFATCMVLENPQLVPPDELLLNGHWRETAVVLCQTQSEEQLQPLMNCVTQLLKGLTEGDDSFLWQIPYYPNQGSQIAWPHGLLHLLGILQDGFWMNASRLPNRIRTMIGRLIEQTYYAGFLIDKKWALEVAGTIDTARLGGLLRNAFARKSQWLRDIAYQQAARLPEVSSEIAIGLRRSLLALDLTHRLRREKLAIHTHLSRLDDFSHFISVMRLVLWIPSIDFILHLVILFILISSTINMLSIILIPLIYLSYSTLTLSYKWALDLGLDDLSFEQITSTIWNATAPFFVRVTLSLLLPYVAFDPAAGINATLIKLSQAGLAWILLWAPVVIVSIPNDGTLGRLWNPFIAPFLVKTKHPIPPARGSVPLSETWKVLKEQISGSFRGIDYHVLLKKTKKLVTYAAVLSLIGFAVVYLFEYHLVFIVILIIIMIGRGLLWVLIRQALPWVIRASIDLSRTKSWMRRNASNPISGRELLGILARLQYSSSWFRILNYVRRQSLLLRTSDSIYVILQLLKTIETRDQTLSSSHTSKGDSAQDFYDQWHHEYCAAFKLEYWRNSSECHDELSRIYEQLASKP